jgi:hypothetical protein
MESEFDLYLELMQVPVTNEISGGESIARGKCPQCGSVGYLQVLNKGRFFRLDTTIRSSMEHQSSTIAE